MATLQLKDIHKSYYLGKEEFPVLKGIDLDFNLGEFVSILGESGGGKSTLMNIIGGLDREFQGEVQLKGKPIDHRNEKSLDRFRRETIGYIYQAYNLVNHLTVLDNVLISLDMTTLTKEQRVDRANHLLERVGLAEQAKKYPNQLSGGQKQRVAIARALASDPQIIIADEPTGALDSQNTAEVLDILNDIAKEGRLVITVTHSQAVADAGTRIVQLVDGKIDSDTSIRQPYPVTGDAERLTARKLPARVSYQTAFKHFKFTFGQNFLIMLGTAIGLFAVILFSGLGNGLSGYINEQITNVANPQVVSVSRHTRSTSNANKQQAQAESQRAAMGMGTTTAKPKTFSQTQISQIRQLKHVTKVEKSYSLTDVKIKHGKKSVTTSTASNWTSSATTSSIKVGHKPQAGEIVLDKTAVAKQLNKKDWKSLIGKTVTVSYSTANANNRPTKVTFKAKVAGIAESSTGAMSITAVNTNTLVKALNKANVSTKPAALAVSIDKLGSVNGVVKQINKLKNDGTKLYAATSITSLISTVQTYVHLASSILAAIAAISLIVSALMIIVTMYMSVSARTKEIGILRALGESKADIRRLFISESLIIGVLSAVLATVIALSLGALANTMLSKIASYAFIQITLGNIITTFVIAIVIALIAAYLPARHAASLNPIDALSAD